MPIVRSAKKNDSTSNNGRYACVDLDKLRGGYYTSREVAEWLVTWAVRSNSDRILEPSCGDGIFLEAAAQRLKFLGARPASIAHSITGIDIAASEVRKARRRLDNYVKRPSKRSQIELSDFFKWVNTHADQRFDAVVGNPPFIRYQSFPEPHRGRAMKLMQECGLKPNKLTNIWVPFVVAACAMLRSGGRLALVLPAELLQVTYASQLRSFLTDRFRRIDIVACNELFFKKAEQEVLLLLADDALKQPSSQNECRVALTEKRKLSDIIGYQPRKVIADAEVKSIQHDHEKWLKYFLTGKEIAFMRELRRSEDVSTLKSHATVDVGVVTGKNEFFVLTKSQLKEFGLTKYASPLVSRSAHLKGAMLNTSEWNGLSAAGDRVHLLHLSPLNGDRLVGPLAQYIHQGELKAIHKGFKCSIRTPWYAVPGTWTPDAFLFRQIYDFPRAVLNQTPATATDTIHRMRCRKEPERTIANTYTYLTAASAEIEGRSYGGGVLELEPTEAERLLMPAKLGDALPLAETDSLVRAGHLEKVLTKNSNSVLKQSIGLSSAECGMLKQIWVKMRDRRMSRRRSHQV